jgi:hypothetical protein
MERQEGVEDRQRRDPWCPTLLGVADVAEHLPFVDCSFHALFLGHDLACHIMPSVIGRRPKGVVAVCVCIFLYLLLGKENLLAETALSLEKLLTVIPEVRFSSTCQD